MNSQPFHGIGLNTHSKLLPIQKLRELGITWVRADCDLKELTEWRVREFLEHYQGFQVIWTISQRGPANQAQKLKKWGVQNIEVGNEPDIDLFNPVPRAWEPSEYAKFWKTVRSYVGKKFKLYGPGASKWNPKFIAECLKLGADPHAITFHGYWQKLEALPGLIQALAKDHNRPALITEACFAADGFPGQDYPERRGQAKGFVDARKLGIPICFYDGPESSPGAGLFKWTGKDWEETTPVFDAIADSLQNSTIK